MVDIRSLLYNFVACYVPTYNTHYLHAFGVFPYLPFFPCYPGLDRWDELNHDPYLLIPFTAGRPSSEPALADSKQIPQNTTQHNLQVELHVTLTEMDMRGCQAIHSEKRGLGGTCASTHTRYHYQLRLTEFISTISARIRMIKST